MRRGVCSFVLVIAACSGGKDGGGTPVPPPPPPPDPGLPLAEFCRELAVADCTRLDRCGQISGLFTEERCRIRQEGRCAGWAEAVRKAVEAQEVTYFELTAKNCRDRALALPCEAGFDYDILGEPECGGLISPRKNENEPCSLPRACNDGLFCDGRSACPGTCKKLKTNNEMCSSTEPCVKDFFCATPARRCHARVALGQPCEVSIAGNACVEGTFCDSSQPGVAVCAPVRGRGNGCTSQLECVPGTRCINSLCSAGMERDSCESDADCGAGLRCGINRCVVVKELGDDECAEAKPCREGMGCFTVCSTCTARACQLRPVVGEECDGQRTCYQGRCVPGAMPMDPSFCEALLDDGETCTTARECQPGRVCDAMTCSLYTPDCSSL